VKLAAPTFLFVLAVAPLAAQELRFGELGDFPLASGNAIRDCRIGYRTFGKLNADRSNAILVLTWANGATEQMRFVPGKPPDPTKFFIIAVDALGNGVSSSPSNSRLQPRMKFPQFTMRDLAATQHALLTKVLKIEHLHAVMGTSMGAMQTFQWIVSYPGFVDRAVPIAGSPRLAPYDLMHWQAQIDALVYHRDWNGGDYTQNPAARSEVEFAILLSTPEDFNAHSTREQAFERLRNAKTTVDANNKIRQVEAMMGLDVADGAAAVKAKVLIVVAAQDHTVTPGPALDFARRVGAQTLTLDGPCGHLAPGCEAAKLDPVVGAFLDK
jgi:homoserine O-acetyltransferase